MKKIPTMFERDWTGDPEQGIRPGSRVLNQLVPGCEWVALEGIATQKLDGTACAVHDGHLYKRHEVKPGKPPPANFEVVDHDEETGKTVGWVPVGDGPEDRWHREAFSSVLPDGTYELIGPKIQGNPEGAAEHMLVRHADLPPLAAVPRDYEGLRAYFTEMNEHRASLEGIVFHHPDGRMAKIKARDFGIPRPRPA